MAINANMYTNKRTNEQTYSREKALRWYRENDDTITITNKGKFVMTWNSMGLAWQAAQAKIK